ncbi:MAG: sulfate permease [bacterium]|nr:sulfate permease [Hoylesella loescheii]MCI6476589.1 sulfate permease [Bacteroidales bacterium]MDO4209561.1 sulfate permease [bacterium]MDY3674809.1 sulfate permease [Prevotella sp.]MCI7038972.1 sulfate permease [Bacteroidales bacterium]
MYKPKLISCLKHYDKKTLSADIMAGIIVGIVALPLAIAFGIASGVSPEKGIITAIVAGLLVSVFGGSKVQIGGPTGAFIIIIYGIIEQYGMSGLTIATFMAGAFLVLFGLLRLGTIIQYIPYPIVVGFTSGIAITIFSTQVKDFFGMQIEKVPSDFVEKWICYANNVSTIDLWSLFIGMLSLVTIIVLPRISKKIPGSLIAIILTTVVALVLRNYLGITSIETIGDRFSISSDMPGADVPELSWLTMKGLVQPALTIALLGAIESLLSATVADGVIGDRHNSNNELIGQGIANLVTPIFGGIPATGAIARTMTNINNGGRTPVAGIIHAVVLLLIFLFLMPLAKYIPMACLAGILVMVSYNMCGIPSFLGILRNPKSDITVLLVTFFLTIIFDLTIAIEVGIVIACLLFMRRMAETSDVQQVRDIDVEEESDLQSQHDEHLIVPQDIEVYEINGPFFFGAGNKAEELMTRFREKPSVRIIRMRKVPFIDSTGVHNLSNICIASKQQGIDVVLSGVNPKVHAVLDKAKLYDIIGEDHICPHIDIALKKAKELSGNK